MIAEQLPSPDPDEVAAVQRVLQLWNSGDQRGAVDSLRNLTDVDRPWAVALTSWLLLQMGAPSIFEGIDWALRAARLGYSFQALQYFNNVAAYLPSDPSQAERLPELLDASQPWGQAVDTVGQGWNLLNQGQPELALRVMAMPPVPDHQWKSMVVTAGGHLREIEKYVAEVAEIKTNAETAEAEATAAMDKARDDLVTSANQAGLLVRSISSDAINALFQADAKRNAKDSRWAWFSGLGVLGAAALVAVLPVVLHYLGEGPPYSAVEQLGVHLASTAALATFSGVLLARARSRDRAAQRAHDLSTAMGTVISYSNQISDPDEKQRFMTAMGQVVLQAHLSSGQSSSAKDDHISGLVALASAARPSGSGAATGG